ncbi:hypothetical protein D9M68_271950 [compost metagenome]
MPHRHQLVLDLHLLLDVAHRKGHVVDRALAVDRRALQAVGFVHEFDDGARLAVRGFEAVVRARLAGVVEVQRLLHEDDGFIDLAQRQRDAVHAADSHVGGNPGGRARRTRVVIGFHQVKLDATGVIEALAAFAEAFGHVRFVGHAPGREAFAPELERIARHRVVDDAHLARSGARLDALLPERERRHQRAGIAAGVAVVEVVDRILAVKQHGLLDEALPQQADVEIHVVLRAADTRGQVMKPFDHRHLSLPLEVEPCE